LVDAAGGPPLGGVDARPSSLSFFVESAAWVVLGVRAESRDGDVEAGAGAGADADADGAFRAGVELRVGRCVPRGKMGTHSRDGSTFPCCVWASKAASSDFSSGSVPALMSSWDGGTVTVDAEVAAWGDSSTLFADGDSGANFRHFSRARRRFGVCGPRADSGEKPSKASQAVAKWGNIFSLGRDFVMRRLRLRTSLGP
jgi:hypothetical protein